MARGTSRNGALRGGAVDDAMRPATKQLYLRLLKHVAPYWRIFALSLVAMVVLAATEPAVPALLKPLLDGSFVNKDLDSVVVLAALLVLVFFIKGVAYYLSHIGFAWVAGKLVMDLNARMFDRLLTLPRRFFDDQPSGTLLSKFTFDVFMVTEAGTHVLTILVRDTLAILGLLAWMFYLDWKLTLISLFTAPVVVLIVQRLAGRLRRMSRNLQQTMGEVTQVLEETIEGRDVVRVFGGMEYERDRFREAINWARRYRFKFASASSISSPTVQFVTAIALAVIVYLAAHQSAADEITVGGFMSFFAAMAMLFPPLKRVTNVNGPLQRGLAAAESVFKLMDEVPEHDDGKRNLKRARGHVELRNVSFQYESGATPALQDVSLVVEPGETVALVGPSGSGKSTLVGLIPRFYLVTKGEIRIDGIDTRDLTLRSLRRNIALVGQDVILFNDTVGANIAYGPLAGSSRKAIEAAADAAHALEFIRELPEGLDTIIGENGVKLSGGQRQRLAIARAFLKDAPILILDEATSSLDTSAERHIQGALDTLRHGRSTIVVAHRLSTVEHAERIVVLANGRVTDTGRHAELLERNHLYAGLYRFQFSRHATTLPAASAK